MIWRKLAAACVAFAVAYAVADFGHPHVAVFMAFMFGETLGDFFR